MCFASRIDQSKVLAQFASLQKSENCLTEHAWYSRQHRVQVPFNPGSACANNHNNLESVTNSVRCRTKASTYLDEWSKSGLTVIIRLKSYNRRRQSSIVSVTMKGEEIFLESIS